MENWEVNPKARNPYEEPHVGEIDILYNNWPVDLTSNPATMLQDIRLELAKEEATERAKSGAAPLHKVSLTGFLTTGFDLEDSKVLPVHHISF